MISNFKTLKFILVTFATEFHIAFSLQYHVNRISIWNILKMKIRYVAELIYGLRSDEETCVKRNDTYYIDYLIRFGKVFL